MNRQQLDAAWEREGIDDMPELDGVPQSIKDLIRSVFERGVLSALSETKRSEGGFGQLVGDALDEMRSPEASALTTFGEQQAVNEAAWELVRRKADSNMNRCQELAQAAVAAYRASVERQRGALPAAPSSTDKERDDAALKLANEWKDWLPYPDSPRAEWDRFNLANAYVALAGARSAGEGRSDDAPKQIIDPPGIAVEAFRRKHGRLPNRPGDRLSLADRLELAAQACHAAHLLSCETTCRDAIEALSAPSASEGRDWESKYKTDLHNFMALERWLEANHPEVLDEFEIASPDRNVSE